MFGVLEIRVLLRKGTKVSPADIPLVSTLYNLNFETGDISDREKAFLSLKFPLGGLVDSRYLYELQSHSMFMMKFVYSNRTTSAEIVLDELVSN